MNKDDKKEIIYKVQKYNSGTLGAGPEYPSEHVYRNMGTTGTSGFTATSRATTPFHAYGILLLGPLVPRPTAPQPLIDHQPTNLNLSNILSIKSKREGSLRGGDEKVFVFYSGTIFSLRHFFYETFYPFLCPSIPQQYFSHRAQTPKRRQKLLAMLPYDSKAARVGVDAPAKLALWQKDAFRTVFQLAKSGEKWGVPGVPSPWPLFFIGF